jgi:hypothetical protein
VQGRAGIGGEWGREGGGGRVRWRWVVTGVSGGGGLGEAAVVAPYVRVRRAYVGVCASKCLWCKHGL